MHKIITLSTNKQISDTQNLRNITEPILNYGTNFKRKREYIGQKSRLKPKQNQNQITGTIEETHTSKMI